MKKLLVVLPDETHRRLKSHAALMGASMTEVVTTLLDDYLQPYVTFTAEDGEKSIQKRQWATSERIVKEATKPVDAVSKTTIQPNPVPDPHGPAPRPKLDLSSLPTFGGTTKKNLSKDAQAKGKLGR